MSSEEIKAYFLHKNRRKTINWTGIENQYEIGKGRIKNVLLAKDVKGGFRADEIEKISKAIQDLQV